MISSQVNAYGTHIDEVVRHVIPTEKRAPLGDVVMASFTGPLPSDDLPPRVTVRIDGKEASYTHHELVKDVEDARKSIASQLESALATQLRLQLAIHDLKNEVFALRMAAEEPLAYTDWFPPSEKPVRIGVYEREYGFGIKFCYWNGNEFCIYSESIAIALTRKRMVSNNQTLRWRGIVR